MRNLLLAYLVTLAASASAAVQEVSVPRQFQGHWASSPAKCNIPHEGSLDIDKNRVDAYEGGGKVVSVQSISFSEVEITLEGTAEGKTWRDTRRFVLSSDRLTLTDATSSKPEYHTKRVRCGKIP